MSSVPATTVANGNSTPSNGVAGPRKYTLKDLQENKTSQQLYMLLHDKVYDVTKFLDEHPGGDEVLIAEGGRDATEAFEDVGHSDDARALLGPMLVGDFVGEKKAQKASKYADGAAATSTKSGVSYTWVLPLTLLIAYLAWKFVLA